jgi:hypothetical protein
MSGPFSRLSEDAAGVFEALKMMSTYAENLEEWLIVNAYLLRAFSKFHTDVEALQTFASTYIVALEEDRFFECFRATIRNSGHLRCLFGSDDTAELDSALERHIKANELGDEFLELMIEHVEESHMDLKNPNVVLPQIEEIVRLCR